MIVGVDWMDHCRRFCVCYLSVVLLDQSVGLRQFV